MLVAVQILESIFEERRGAATIALEQYSSLERKRDMGDMNKYYYNII